MKDCVWTGVYDEHAQLSEINDDLQASLYLSTFARCGLLIKDLLRAYYAGKGDPQSKHVS